MAVLYAAWQAWMRKPRKPKGTRHPTRVWECAVCGARYRMSRTHQPSLWQKARKRRLAGRGTNPLGPQFDTYLVDIFIGTDGERKARKAENRS